MILYSVGPGSGALAAPAISRQLREVGHDVEVILTPGARSFIGPAALDGATIEEPSQTPDVVLHAPASSGTMARLARGMDPEFADFDGSAVFVAPELDPETSHHPAVEKNLELLRDAGVRVIEGSGDGMAPADEVVAAVLGGIGGPLAGKRVIVTAGGTREPIDSVRFVGNRSSGKMGLAVAREALHRGAEVSVVAANVEKIEAGVEWLPVESVGEMRDAVVDLAAKADVLVMAAAVSDFTPADQLHEKVRRQEGLRVEFVPTADILAEVGESYPDLFVVGFAATHGNPVADAREKLRSKGADIIVGNDISQAGIGFASEENEVYVVGESEATFVPRTSKSEVARAILDVMISMMGKERRE